MNLLLASLILSFQIAFLTSFLCSSFATWHAGCIGHASLASLAKPKKRSAPTCFNAPQKEQILLQLFASAFWTRFFAFLGALARPKKRGERFGITEAHRGAPNQSKPKRTKVKGGKEDKAGKKEQKTLIGKIRIKKVNNIYKIKRHKYRSKVRFANTEQIRSQKHIIWQQNCFLNLAKV